jgi:hypothetical protein
MEKCGYLDEALHYTMDYDYWLRLGAVLDPIIIKQRLANFRIHNQSKGETAYIKQFTEDEITSSKYSHSSYLNLLHKTHNVLIMWVYKIIK